MLVSSSVCAAASSLSSFLSFTHLSRGEERRDEHDAWYLFHYLLSTCETLPKSQWQVAGTRHICLEVIPQHPCWQVSPASAWNVVLISAFMRENSLSHSEVSTENSKNMNTGRKGPLCLSDHTLLLNTRGRSVLNSCILDVSLFTIISSRRLVSLNKDSHWL